MSGQAAFARALPDPAARCPAALAVPPGARLARRFAIHRNNVVLGLVDALAENFPVTRRRLGEVQFRIVARQFVRACPPASPMLFEYGAKFPAFIAGHPPAAGLACLAELAQLEFARLTAWHAADAQGLGAADFAAALARPEHLSGLRLRLVPSAAVLDFAHAVVSLWAAHQDETAPAAIALDRPEAALIVRPADEVLVFRLPPGGAAFLGALAAGQTLGLAAAAAARIDGFDLARLLELVIRAGAVAAMDPQPETLS